MKNNYFFTFFVALLFVGFSNAQIIAQWNFNGPSNTEVPGGATSPSPSVGSGTAALVGGTTATFASGIANGGSSDPVTTVPENYGWNTTTYAALGTENKQRGVEFWVSTVGFSNIFFMFDQRMSNTGNNTWVVQYNAGAGWVDAETFTVVPQETGTGDTWFNQRTANLSSISAINNLPNAGFRVVAAFDPTTNDYRAIRSTSTYGPGGTARFDMVTISQGQLSTNNFNVDMFSIYPNPAHAIVNFSKEMSGQVLNINGQVLINFEKVNQISIDSLQPGVYFVKNNEGATQKLMVK